MQRIQSGMEQALHEETDHDRLQSVKGPEVLEEIQRYKGRIMHYFDNPEEAKNDHLLRACKQQGYCPPGCLLSGRMVYGLTAKGKYPCDGCNSDRSICGGQPKRGE